MNETYECPECHEKVTLPSDVSELFRREVADLCRRSPVNLYTVMSLKQLGGNLGLYECKFIVWHMSALDSYCGKCGHKLLESGITFCPTCNSLNLNW